MRISHLLYIIAKHLCKLAVGVESKIRILNFLLPGAKVTLIDCHRFFQFCLTCLLLPVVNPAGILPLISGQARNHVRIVRSHLTLVSIWICLV